MVNRKAGSKRSWLKLGWLCWIVVLLLAGGCASGSYESSDSAGSYENAKADTGYATATSAHSSAESEQAKDDVDQTGGGFGTPSMQAPSSSVAAGLNLKMIYTANMVMEVADYVETQSEIRNLVMLSNGYILEFSDNQTIYERGGRFVVKVPADGFMSFIDGLQSIKTEKPPQLSMQGKDVTEEYVDLSSRLKAKQVTEERLLAFMEKATGTDDLVRFTQELGKVQEEIEQIKGRMRYIDQNVAFSTVEIRVYEKLEKQEEPVEAANITVWDRAIKGIQGSLNFLIAFFSELFIFLVAALPILIVFGLIAFVSYKYYRRVMKSRRSSLKATPLPHGANMQPLQSKTLDSLEDGNPSESAEIAESAEPTEVAESAEPSESAESEKLAGPAELAQEKLDEKELDDNKTEEAQDDVEQIDRDHNDDR